MLLDTTTQAWKIYTFRHGREANRKDFELIVDLVHEQPVSSLVLRQVGKGKVRMLTLTLPRLQKMIKAVEDHRQTLLDCLPPVQVGYEKTNSEEVRDADKLLGQLQTELGRRQTRFILENDGGQDDHSEDATSSIKDLAMRVHGHMNPRHRKISNVINAFLDIEEGYLPKKYRAGFQRDLYQAMILELIDLSNALTRTAMTKTNGGQDD